MTHTPGPWRLGPIHKDGSFAIHADTASVVHCKPFGSSQTSAIDNGKLMAAAPDLLEAAREMVATEMYFGDHPKRQAAYNLARAAIAKTEGK